MGPETKENVRGIGGGVANTDIYLLFILVQLGDQGLKLIQAFVYSLPSSSFYHRFIHLENINFGMYLKA